MIMVVASSLLGGCSSKDKASSKALTPEMRNAAIIAIAQQFATTQDVEAASPYRIEVQPGTARVPRGSDQTITARLAGFTADDTTLVARKGPERLVLTELATGVSLQEMREKTEAVFEVGPKVAA